MEQVEDINGRAIGKYISIIYRFGHIFYERNFKNNGISGGQQFFLLEIFYHPGISQFELTKKGGYDKGTTARAVKKLEESGYIQRVECEKDRRVYLLYPTDKAEPFITSLIEQIESWHTIMTEGLTREEVSALEGNLKKLTHNVVSYVWKMDFQTVE